MVTRRDFLTQTAAGLWIATAGGYARGGAAPAMISRVVPTTGERLPIIGLGGSASFRSAADGGDEAVLAPVFDALLSGGGKVFDTAAIYGRSEEVAGRITAQRGSKGRVFWATKVYVRPGSVPDEAKASAARTQIERSFDRIGKEQIDLIQLHDITSVDAERGILEVLESLKREGRTRYIGATSIRKEHYADLEQAMRQAPLDFIGIDYAIDNREAARRILPLAAERGVAVLAYRPFGNTRLWDRVRGHVVPPWAAEIGVHTWAQFFVKYVAAHPAVTVVTPGTSSPAHMADNLAAGAGPLPDMRMLRRMERHLETLPRPAA